MTLYLCMYLTMYYLLQYQVLQATMEQSVAASQCIGAYSCVKLRKLQCGQNIAVISGKKHALVHFYQYLDC